MPEEKIKILEKKVDALQNDVTMIVNLLSSNSDMKTVGLSEQVQTNTKAISKLNNQIKLFIGLGSTISGAIAKWGNKLL